MTKQTTLEPGLLQILRVYVVVALLLLPLVWRSISLLSGMEAPLGGFLTPGQPVLLFLVIYVFVPWWQRHMGRFFLPVAILLLAMQASFGNYLTLFWLVPPAARAGIALVFMVRVWANAQFLVLFVAWQYDLFWALVAGIGITLLDAALYFPLLRAGAGGYYPFYAAIVTGRLLSVNVVGLGFAWLMKRQREQRAALAQTNQKLAEANQKLAEANQKLSQHAAATEQLAVSQERNRMARELHDTLAHSLSGVIVQLEATEALWEVNVAGARNMLSRVHQSARSGLTEVRRALYSLRASPLEDLGLALAIRELAESVATRTELKLQLEVADHIESLPPDVEQCMYRVAQEVLTNVARHAKATSLHVSLIQPNGCLVLRIIDDGQGFDSKNVADTRYGLKGLRERAEMIGGALEIESKYHQGTTVQLSIPLPELKNDANLNL